MLIEAARRAEAYAKEMLTCINAGSASCAEAREALEISRAFMAAGSAFQVAAAQAIAKAERHGDGGAQVLADGAGMHKSDAHSRVKTAQVIQTAPAVRDAVESGRVSHANAKRLADAIDKTSADVVESDGDLLAKAQSMRPEQFTREARRWVADHQHDGSESEHARQRARRRVRIWHNDDDGMVHLRGEFDTVTGRQIESRLRAQARLLHDTDKKHAADGEAQRRSFDQCMADALDHLTNATSSGDSSSGGGKSFADICVVAHVDDATGELIAELPDGERLPQSVLEQLSCNAKLTGVVYDRCGKPIWRTHSRRTVTESQWQLLIAKYGGCFHCGANPGICQGHHIEPASRGGPTKLDNLVPACWSCHHRIHHDNWRIRRSPDGWHTLHPPDRVSYGPAHAPEQPIPARTARTPRQIDRAANNHDPGPLHHGGMADANEPHLAKPRMSLAMTRGGSGPAAARAVLRSARARRDRRHPTDGSHPDGARAGPERSTPPSNQHDRPLPLE